jgi:hypothetical protein
MWMINNGYVEGLPHINGIGIIRVDKQKRGVINDVFVNEFNDVQRNMIYGYQRCFMSYVDAYYRTISTDYITNNYNYFMSEVFTG